MSKIFCIDDSAIVRTEIKKVAEAAGYRVVEAQNGRHALQVIVEHPDIKLIFCDVNMPEMNGIEFCEELAKLEQYKHIPVLMFTTEIRPDLKERAKAAGVRGWLVKPFSASKVTAAMKQLLA